MQLALDGAKYRFTGVNAYQLGTQFSVNIGCGSEVDNFDALFGALPPGSMVRTWAFQSQAWNKNTQRLDWGPLDRVIAAAGKRGVKLILTLGEQAGVCDSGHWHDKAWYLGGYRQAFDDNGRHDSPMSYWDWIHAIVPRYKDSPTVGMWELINEPQPGNCGDGVTGEACYGRASCPDLSSESLKSFFDVVGAEVKRLDPGHLVASGTIGHNECGNWEYQWKIPASSPGVDVLTVHVYDTEAYPYFTQLHVSHAEELGKPILLEEVGTDADNGGGGPGCISLAARSDIFKSKMDSAFTRTPVAGFLAWQWMQYPGAGCNLQIGPADPAMALLRTYKPAA